MRVRTATVVLLFTGALLSLSGCCGSGEYGPWLYGASNCPGADCCPRGWSSWHEYGLWVSGDTSCCQRAPVAGATRGIPEAKCGVQGCGEHCPVCALGRRAAAQTYRGYPGAGVRVVGPGQPQWWGPSGPGVVVRRVPSPGPTTVPETPPPPTSGTLFERLGGLAAIEAVVDDFIARFAKNPTILENEKVKAWVETGDVPGFRRHLIDQICQATGGPCVYKGGDMKSVHAGLGITEAQWDAGAADLVAALESKGVQEPEKSEVMAIVGPIKADVVETP
jgi:hemoglobin